MWAPSPRTPTSGLATSVLCGRVASATDERCTPVRGRRARDPRGRGRRDRRRRHRAVLRRGSVCPTGSTASRRALTRCLPCTPCRPRRPWAHRSDRLGPGRSAAPGEQRLTLLPSGPDVVHASPLRGTRSSTPLAPSASANAGLERGFSPAGADCRYRAPLVPRLARPGDDSPSGSNEPRLGRGSSPMARMRTRTG